MFKTEVNEDVGDYDADFGVRRRVVVRMGSRMVARRMLYDF